MSDKILPVVMAGGSGSRLWPMSRTHFPKQFLSLTGEASMLQETINRLKGLEHLPSCLICNQEHRFLVAEQLNQMNIPHGGIILEPVGRNTAPAVALAAFKAIQAGDDPLLLVLAADHLIKDTEAFQRSVEEATSLANEGYLVTFGIVPTAAETGYGYIKRGQGHAGSLAFDVNSFVEKPDLETAKNYLKEGSYYWNSGMFMFKASKFLSELKLFRPDIYKVAERSLAGASVDLDFIRIPEKEFSQCPDDSIDYAVMEKTQRAKVVPMDAGWSDVGAWSSLWEVAEKDESGNVLSSDVISINSKNNYVLAPKRLVATIGVSDLVIVDTEDALLVAKRDEVQKNKAVVNQLKSLNRSEHVSHRQVYRPWGHHEQIAEGERYHVKKVLVKPGEKTAKQIHYHRSEHWVVVSGTARVHKGDKSTIVSENESIYIPVGVLHSFENPGKVPLEIIEVRTGGYLEEDDIVRVDYVGEGY
ncbi:mannose-1-phosphate guanylyltransferase/mannose-6-phosphate isomerase [Vibrio coralliilyticus]|uniref:mannose-1-phosphate guanylyltransferase/mannose-6-phosphate isomerase n=1 Tax=Vibrio TaxID=662 RepID=UPI000502D29C|nr:MULTISPECIES: mannose-1-phosphate guanylyltransferase/mannose-6-phosphate isomerase [Vibrio]KFI09648.1 mannose-1-phosphate guanyltransferase [Vibrio sp. B183]NOI19531.1 mannose-1-phosphate guanylyltransferase/mannose-6-phosphate isomerase [Vibrio coralliilyticus]NRF15942.1 mannose-1-phosphate guanylyltransferase/mannose-6-phosphate isomerase [Vibrio coralliilyticus]PAU37306.1 mannose-1-phosphate guanylyltransferase/mannose-6-phosphate isomerase [Vibrio coralliilyticus]